MYILRHKLIHGVDTDGTIKKMSLVCILKSQKKLVIF
jgi:hypothetical protein